MLVHDEQSIAGCLLLLDLLQLFACSGLPLVWCLHIFVSSSDGTNLRYQEQCGNPCEKWKGCNYFGGWLSLQEDEMESYRLFRLLWIRYNAHIVFPSSHFIDSKNKETINLCIFVVERFIQQNRNLLLYHDALGDHLCTCTALNGHLP